MRVRQKPRDPSTRKKERREKAWKREIRSDKRTALCKGSFTKFSLEETTAPRSSDNKLPAFEVRAFAKITLQL